MDIISRKEAIARGLDYYFTGKPCKRGHIDKRKTQQCGCVSCDRDYYKENKETIIGRVSKWQKENKDHRAEYMSTYRSDNLERLTDYNKKYYYTNVDYRRSYSREYHYENREDIVKYLRQRYQDNKEHYAEKAKIWRANNIDVVRASKTNRKAAVRNAEGKHTDKDITEMLDNQSYLCVYCDADLSEGYHVDHIMPIALGGSNWPDNLQCLCPTCNTRKGAKHPDDWHREIGYS